MSNVRETLAQILGDYVLIDAVDITDDADLVCDLAVAARHHDATQHQTWCDVTLCYVYGAAAKDDRQTDIEDAIAQASR